MPLPVNQMHWQGRKKNLSCFTPPMLSAECTSHTSAGSGLGVPEGAGVSEQDGCDCGFLSVRFHRVLVFKKQRVCDGELLLCVLVLRWIFKDAQ